MTSPVKTQAKDNLINAVQQLRSLVCRTRNMLLLRASAAKGAALCQSPTVYVRNTNCARTAVCICLCLLFYHSVSWSQEKQDPVQLSTIAYRKAEKGDIKEAVELWRQVVDKLPEKQKLAVMVNLGLGYKTLGELPEAWYYLTRYLSKTSGQDPEVSAWVKEVQGQLVRTHTKITIVCKPQGATIQLRGVRYLCPLQWWFKPGRHTVRVEKSGYERKVVALDIQKGRAKAVYHVELKPTVEYGILEIIGPQKGAKVVVNGKVVGKIPFKGKIQAGAHKIEVRLEGFDVWRKEVQLSGGKRVVEKVVLKQLKTTPDKQLSPPSSRIAKQKLSQKPGIIRWALLGGGLALVGVGGLLHYTAYTKNQDLRKKYPADQNLGQTEFEKNAKEYEKQFEDEVVPLRIASYALYGVGAGAAIAGGILVFVQTRHDRAKNKESQFHITPMPLVKGSGIAIQWIF